MNIKYEIIEMRQAIEKFAKSQNMSTEEACRLLLEADVDVREIISDNRFGDISDKTKKRLNERMRKIENNL